MNKERVKLFVFVSIATLIFYSSSVEMFSLLKIKPFSTQGEVEIRQVEPFVYCSMTRKGSFSEIEAAIGELMQNMQNQNIFPAGAMIGIYHGDPSLSDPESIMWEVGFPVGEQAFIQAPLEKKQWTFTTVAVGIHEGPYEKTGETILKMREWLEGNGYVQNGPVLERYLDPDPSRTSPERLRTEIWLPCKRV